MGRSVENGTSIEPDFSRGRIEVITGNMFSGKSEELIRRVRRAEIAVEAWIKNGLIDPTTEICDVVKVFKPEVDNRRGKDSINSDNGNSHLAISIDGAERIFDFLSGQTRVVAIDEAQFFEGRELVKVVKKLAREQNVRVIVAGLALDFKGEVWGGVSELAVHAEETVVLSAICSNCGSNEGNYTQRTVNGHPANYKDPVVMVGAKESYEARCRFCHQVSGHPDDD